MNKSLLQQIEDVQEEALLKGSLEPYIKVAEQYAIKREIELINNLTFAGSSKGQILYKGFDIDLYLQQLEEKLQ